MQRQESKAVTMRLWQSVYRTCTGDETSLPTGVDSEVIYFLKNFFKSLLYQLNILGLYRYEAFSGNKNDQ